MLLPYCGAKTVGDHKQGVGSVESVETSFVREETEVVHLKIHSVEIVQKGCCWSHYVRDG